MASADLDQLSVSDEENDLGDQNPEIMPIFEMEVKLTTGELKILQITSEERLAEEVIQFG